MKNQYTLSNHRHWLCSIAEKPVHDKELQALTDLCSVTQNSQWTVTNYTKNDKHWLIYVLSLRTASEQWLTIQRTTSTDWSMLSLRTASEQWLTTANNWSAFCHWKARTQWITTEKNFSHWLICVSCCRDCSCCISWACWAECSVSWLWLFHSSFSSFLHTNHCSL